MNISPAIQTAVGRSLLHLQKQSPVILTAVGVGAVLAAGVLAAKNTLKLEDTLIDAQVRINEAKSLEAEGAIQKSDITRVYLRNATDLVKLYWAPTTLMAGGLIAILSAQNILHKRNAALAAGYKTLETAIKAYRERVAEEYGEDAEKRLWYGEKTETYLDEKGKKKTRVVTTDAERVGASDYVFSFGPENANWTGYHDRNLYLMELQQSVFNDRLQAYGHVFLSEVLDALGMARTKASIVTGWVYSQDNVDGDNFIDFGIRDHQEDLGYILLDFNVDGLIYDKIG